MKARAGRVRAKRLGEVNVPVTLTAWVARAAPWLGPTDEIAARWKASVGGAARTSGGEPAAASVRSPHGARCRPRRRPNDPSRSAALQVRAGHAAP